MLEDVAGEDEEDAPHAGEEGGGDQDHQDQPVPGAEVAQLEQEGVVVLGLGASIRPSHHYCSAWPGLVWPGRDNNAMSTLDTQHTEVRPVLTYCVIRKAGTRVRREVSQLQNVQNAFYFSSSSSAFLSFLK